MGWRNVYKYEYKDSLEEIKKIKIAEDFDDFTALNPIAEEFMQKSYEAALEDLKKRKPPKIKYLEKKLLLNKDTFTPRYISFTNENIDDKINEYLESQKPKEEEDVKEREFLF